MSYSAMRADGVAIRPASTASVGERITFIRKVYGLVFLGILFFAASIALPVLGSEYLFNIPVLRDIYALSAWLPWWAALLLIIGSSFVVHAVSMVRGLNLVAFFAMSFLWAFLTIPMIATTFAVGGSIAGGLMMIVQAAGLTTLVFGGLTVYVFVTKKDFSFMRGFLTMGLVLSLGAIVALGVGSMMGWVEQMGPLNIGLSIILVLLFAGYVLYDTSNVIHHYATDMVVPAALALMVDFIILFRQILFLIIASRD